MAIQTITCKCTAEETLKIYAFNAKDNVMHDVLKSTVVAATEVEIDSDVIYIYCCTCCEQVIMAFREGPCMTPTAYATVTSHGKEGC